MKLTYIQFYDFSHDDFDSNGDVVWIEEYSANVAIETQGKEFLIQLYGYDNECGASIPSPDEQFWGSEEDQAWAYENLDSDEVMDWLESQGVENNFHWLKENADIHI